MWKQRICCFLKHKQPRTLVLFQCLQSSMKKWMDMLKEAAFMEDHTLNPTNPVGLAERIQGKKTPQAGSEETTMVTDPDRRARVRFCWGCRFFYLVWMRMNAPFVESGSFCTLHEFWMNERKLTTIKYTNSNMNDRKNHPDGLRPAGSGTILLRAPLVVLGIFSNLACIRILRSIGGSNYSYIDICFCEESLQAQKI